MSQHELSQRAAGARLLPDSVVPPHLLCNSCSNPLFNAFQTPHGCRLCQSCVSGLPPTAAAERRRCPGNTEACRDEQEEIVVSQATCFADMATRRELSRVVRVQCPNSNAGCTITLTWGQVDSHLEMCTFQTLACDLCNKQEMKSNMQHHLTDFCEQRTIKCDQCNNMVPFCDMLTKHRNLQSDVCCVKFTALCPHCNDASRKLDRREYVGHVVECPESPVVCKYSHLGCSVRLRRSEMEEHYKSSSDHHLGLMDAVPRQQSSSQQRMDLPGEVTSSQSQQAHDMQRLSTQNAFERHVRATGQPTNRLSMETSSQQRVVGSSVIAAATHTVQLPLQQSVQSDAAVCMLRNPHVQLTANWEGHTDNVTAACAVINMQAVATGSAEGTVLLWDLIQQNPFCRIRAPLSWGPVTCLAGLRDQRCLLLLGWKHMIGLRRLKVTEQLSQSMQDSSTSMLELCASTLELVGGIRSCTSNIAVFPDKAAAAVSLADGSLLMVAATGYARSLLDTTGSAVDFLAAPESGWILMRRVDEQSVTALQMRTDLPGSVTVSRIRTIDLHHHLPANRSIPMVAWPVRGPSGAVALAFGSCQPGCITIVLINELDEAMLLLGEFQCDSSDVTSIIPMTADAAHGLRLFATASTDSCIRFWRVESLGGRIRLLEVN